MAAVGLPALSAGGLQSHLPLLRCLPLTIQRKPRLSVLSFRSSEAPRLLQSWASGTERSRTVPEVWGSPWFLPTSRLFPCMRLEVYALRLGGGE